MREAEVRIADSELAEMGIEELVSVATDAGLIAFDELACRGTGAVIQIEVKRRCDESRLAGLSYVDTFNHVVERESSHVYVISFTAPDLPEQLADTAADLVGTCDPEIGADGATMSLVGPQEAIAGQLGAYENAGVSATLQRLGGYDGPASPLDALTGRQRDVLETAWEMGYYAVPKAVSAAEIANEMGLDPSTINEHLQRAERNLLEQIL
jgi:DNA-binding NarL/FixJ family response regulator